ncbi:MAG: DUF1846 domain-containing protein [archaeon]|nr:DUF1846 domain-containing protein [archaeon]
MMAQGFDSAKYIELQTKAILNRMDSFGGKLYLEVGGKIFDDLHASRILPGFLPDNKIRMLATMKDRLEAIVCVSCNDIQKSKERGDLGVTYDIECLRMIEQYQSYGIKTGNVVLTMYTGQPAADKFREILKEKGINSYLHYPIHGYPENTDLIVSDNGYGKNDYVETTMPVVLVTAPGPGSGKMAVALSQVYQDNRKGIKSGYAKFETFPVWNLPLYHPVNLAYEAATVDLEDINLIDPFHLAAHGITAINYNRDVETFPVLKALFEKIFGETPYQSPTDMGVNHVGFCICNEGVVKEASEREIVRRYYRTYCDKLAGKLGDGAVRRMDTVMKQANVTPDAFPLYKCVREAASEYSKAIAGIELSDGTIVLGKRSTDLTAVSAAILNALKVMGGIDKEKDIVLRDIIKPVQDMRTQILGNENTMLRADEMMLALAISASKDELAKKALDQIGKLNGCDIHCSVTQYPQDLSILRKLGMNVTCEPVLQTRLMLNH